MSEELHILTEGKRMGRVVYDNTRDRLSFQYDAEWLGDGDKFPLSLSMPLSQVTHAHDVVLPFIWGLLPDNDEVLRRWGTRFHVSPRNPFRLLSHVGEDCAGGIQLARPERVEECLGARRTGRIVWLDEKEIATRMKLLIEDHSATRTGADRGHFSLAGAQPKTAFHFDTKNDRWGVPSGAVATTHIFKPATGAYDGYAENEHFCLSLARALKLPVANSAVGYFGDVAAIIVERFDRARIGAKVRRIHQEDMCQALGRMPHVKYQNQGGPSAAEIIGLIRQHSVARQADEARFVDALILNWLIAGTDAHAKNYALLIAGGGVVRLAPFYDISSALPYPRQVHPRDAKLAMKIGGKYELLRIGAREWRSFAKENRLDFDRIRARIGELAATIPDIAPAVAKAVVAQGIKHSVIQRTIAALAERCGKCATLK